MIEKKIRSSIVGRVKLDGRELSLGTVSEVPPPYSPPNPRAGCSRWVAASQTSVIRNPEGERP